MTIHSDTTWEHRATYEFFRQWTPWLEEHRLNIVTVTDTRQAARVVGETTDIPAFTVNENNGSRGQLRRQCTGQWKIQPNPLFAHSTRQPLEEAVTIPVDFGVEQMGLFGLLNAAVPGKTPPAEPFLETLAYREPNVIDTVDAECDEGYCFL